MCELNDMLKRSNLSNLISYLVYDVGSNGETIGNYEKRLKESYETIFSELEKMYSEADRQDDSLFGLVVDFATVHDNIYFETGVLVGFQLYKGLDEGYRNHTRGDIQAVVEKYANMEKTKKTSEKESLLEQFFEARADTALEESVRKDMKYQKASAEIRKEVKKIDKIKLNHKQWGIVDNALSACNNKSAEYGRIAYMQGFKDAANLLLELCGLA